MDPSSPGTSELHSKGGEMQDAALHRTGRGPRRQAASRAGARRRLLEAGARLFGDRGFDRVNSNEVAREAGLGVGTFYAHFRDKHELHRALVLEALDALAARMEAAAAGGEDDAVTRVRRLVSALVGFAEEDPARFRVAVGRDAAGLRTGVGISTRAAERSLGVLQAEGRVDPALHPAVASRAFAGAQAEVLCWWLEDPGRARRDELIETLVRLHPAVAARTGTAR
jgi:AcrR family transcriptional regulator